MKLARRLSLFLAGAVLAGCSADPRLSSGLKVRVQVDPSSKSQCIRIIATPESGSSVPTRAIARKDEITVAVYKGEDWSGKTTVVARGYASCDDDVPNFIEESATQVREALEGEVTLILKGTTTVVDVDGDGKSGADDCDDNDSQRFVGNAELCTSTKDNNCSNTTGCADSACTGACAANGLGTCTAGTCIGSTELSCVDGADNDTDGLIDCMDSDCSGSSCNDGNACTGTDVCVSDGGCAGAALPTNCGAAPSGTCLFGAGACNPADGGCMYRARDAGLSCTDSNACTLGDLCLLDGGCNPGAPKVCNTPGTNACLSANGACLPADGGCSYPVLVGNTCNDNVACTDMDMCQADAGCRGTPKVCYQTTIPCKADAGVCNAGTCTYANLANGTSCDDGNQCTLATTCNNGTCINGSAVTCTPMDICHDAGTCSPATGCSNPQAPCVPTECQMGGTCTPPGGCAYTNKADNTSCASGSGVCMSGVCQLNFQPFDRYVPSNFDAGAATPTRSITINCAATLNTGSGSTQASFTGCSGQSFNQSNGIEIITQEGSTLQAALIRMTSLMIADGGTLTITGDRPAILAVYGDARVGGEVRLSANMATRGPGSDLNCADRSLMNGGSTSGEGSGGAGGAGFADNGANGSKGDNYGAGAGDGQLTSGNITLTPLRGGCAGATGGGTGGGVGGGGGGALQLSVSRHLRLVGTIHANGGGGQGGSNGILSVGDGAGSGGSGGGILLEADTVTLESTTKLFANGGTGGEGGDSTGVGRRNSGFNGQLAWGITPGPGDGSGGANGGAGGGGATIKPANPSGAPGGSSGGGGGGGGSTGRIYLRFNSSASNCLETGYVISPSTAATNGDVNTNGIGFGASRALPGDTGNCQ